MISRAGRPSTILSRITAENEAEIVDMYASHAKGLQNSQTNPFGKRIVCTNGPYEVSVLE